MKSILAASNGILEPDDDMSRVYCKACDLVIERVQTYYLRRHVQGPNHKGIVDKYNEMVENNEESIRPFDAARFKYDNNHLYEYLSQNDIEDVKVRMTVNTVEQTETYKIVYFCHACEAEIPPNTKSLARHINGNLHKKDSKGHTAERFNTDTCKLFLMREYIIYSNENPFEFYEIVFQIV